MNLSGRNALITGVSRRAGIGYSIARLLREAGAAVFAQGWAEHDAAQPWGSELNHARSGHGRLGDLTAAEIDAFLHENVRAALLLVREFAARRYDSRPGGRVVLMTSGQHLAPMGCEIAYAVSKGALQQATLSLADELADRAITVNTVNPGPTDTGWGLADHDPAGKMPFGRWGRPDDAARLVAWLCSDDAGWITGQTINSEGGFRRWG